MVIDSYLLCLIVFHKSQVEILFLARHLASKTCNFRSFAVRHGAGACHGPFLILGHANYP